MLKSDIEWYFSSTEIVTLKNPEWKDSALKLLSFLSLYFFLYSLKG